MHKLQGNKIFWTLTLALFLGAALFCAAKQGVLLKADADEAIALDPLNGLWNSRIIPKHRLMVSSFEQTTEKTNVKTMMGTKEKVVEGKNLNDDYNSPDNIDYTNDGCHDSSNYLPTAIPFALATTEGYVPSSVEISPDFYGITRFNNVPQNIIVTSFIVKKDDMYSQLGFDIYKQGTSGKLAMPKRILIDNIYPAYQFNFKGDGSWKKAEPLGVTTMHDIVAHDWNNDGYSDYAVTFVTAKGGHDTETYMRVMLVDGKKLYSTSNSYLYSDSYTWVNGSEGTKINAGGSIVGGLTAIKPTTSIRMVKGDFDGDGTPELAAFFTAIEGSAADVSRPAKLAVYKIEDPANSSVFTTSTMFSTDHGGSLKANDITGIAAGDIDGDGLDEIAALYTESSASGTTARAKLSILKYNATKKTFDFIVKSSEITLTYNPAGWEDSVSPINASITDLDGDGYGELTWSTVKDDGGLSLHLWVHKWNIQGDGKIVGNGSIYEYDMKNQFSDKFSWTIHKYDEKRLPDSMSHSLCVGAFNYPDKNAVNYNNLRHQIALVQQTLSDNKEAVADINYGVFSWDSSSGLECLGYGLLSDPDNKGKKNKNYYKPVCAAVDFNNESLILGEPQSFSVTDNIETVLVAQAPPKHWDVVLAKGSALSADANGMTAVDAFSLFSKDGNAGTTDSYYVGFASDSTQSSGTSTTSTSKSTWSAALTYQLDRRESLLKKVFANNGQAGDDPLLAIGGKYSGSQAAANTAAYTSSMTTTFAFEANRDDQVYYKSNGYELSRYPILYPESKRWTTVFDDETGKNVNAQRYLQFIVPTEVDTSLSPANGRSIAWYEPMHDNYNLFTYPWKLQDIAGYPLGKDAKAKSDALDPWLNRNGTIFTKSEVPTGNPDLSNFKISTTDTSAQSAMSSLQQTTGGNVNFHPKFGIKNRQQLKIDLASDYTWGTDTTTTMNASKMLSVMFYWPGATTYTAVQNNNLTTADMGFRSDCGYYSQDDGTMAIGFAVTGLYGTGRLWGAGSPYSKYPDPGFNLPFRWDYQIQKNPLDHLVENSDPQKRYQLRGIKFEKNIGGQTSTTGSLQNGLGLRLLEKGTDYKITLRVINYSFVSANNVTVKYYYQPWDENNPDPAANYPVDNPASSSKCRFLVDNKITSIAGRKSNTDNWALSNIIWTVPKEPGLGYLHTVIDFAGQTELNAANNHGYTLVGMYDPKIFENVTNQIQSASASSLSVIDPEKRPDLQLISVSATELKEDGTLGEEVTLNNNARYKKLKITVKAKFTGGLINIGGNEKSVQYMPIVGIGLFTGKKYQTSLLAAEEYPVLTEGNEKELSFVYDPKNPGYDVKNGVSVKIFSPLLGVKEQKNLEDNVKVLWNTQDASSGGSGGCATTAFPLVLLALLPLAFRKKK